jgi:hypothetical protein
MYARVSDVMDTSEQIIAWAPEVKKAQEAPTTQAELQTSRMLKKRKLRSALVSVSCTSGPLMI